MKKPLTHGLKKQGGGFALGLIVGLLAGLAVALAVALYVTKTPVPLMNKAQQPNPAQDAAEIERNKNWDPNAALAGKAGTRPANPDAPDASATPASDSSVVPRVAAPVLPTPADNGRVTPAPAGALSTSPTSASAPAVSSRSARDAAAILNGQASIGDGSEAKAVATANTDPFIYFVQVGAYSRTEDAEQQRAKLALAGIRTTISNREQNGRTVYRVRLGPFEKKEDADAQEDRAKAIDPDAALVRVERAKQ